MGSTAAPPKTAGWIPPSLISLAYFLLPLNLDAAQKYLLKPKPLDGGVRQVKVELDVRGSLKLNADGKEVKKVPMAVDGKLLYDELPKSGEGTLRAIRYYRAAEARIKIGPTELTPRLASDRRLIVVHQQQNQNPTLISSSKHLTRDDLDLIEVPGNSAMHRLLLPNDAKGIGDHWKHPSRTAEVLFGLEAVSSSELKSTLIDVSQTEATVELTGTINGAVGGVSSDLEVKGKYRFDFRNRLITWLAIAIEENRSIGHATPGFEVVARLRITKTPIESSEYLTQEVLAEIPDEAPAGHDLLEFQSVAGGFRMLHDRRWQVMIDETKVTILRFVDRGDLVAQCNVSQLTDLPAGQHLRLEQFQADIQKSLGERFGQFIEASQSENELGYRVLRIVAIGVVSKLPIQWTYYHVSNDEGRRVSFVVTMEGKYVERFAVADLALASSFEFTDRLQSDPPEPNDTSQRPGLNRHQLRR